jgi:hypothetical protein
MGRRKTKTEPLVEPLATTTEPLEQNGPWPLDEHGAEAGAELEALLADPEEAAAIAEIDAQIALPKSVVGRAYKVRYKERAMAAGLRGKAAKRSCNDWLAQELQAQTLDEREKLVVEAFEAILDANGIQHANWSRTSKGWQGRLRMSGRMALQRAVAASGALALPSGESLEAPADWVAKHTH